MPLDCGAGEDLESPLDYREIKPVNPKGNQPWIFFGRTDAKAEAPKLWPESWLFGKDPDAWKKWKQKGKEAAEDEMIREHHEPNGSVSEQTPGDGRGQRSLVCCNPWSLKECSTTKRLNNNNTINGYARMYSWQHPCSEIDRNYHL